MPDCHLGGHSRLLTRGFRRANETINPRRVMRQQSSNDYQFRPFITTSLHNLHRILHPYQVQLQGDASSQSDLESRERVTIKRERPFSNLGACSGHRGRRGTRPRRGTLSYERRGDRLRNRRPNGSLEEDNKRTNERQSITGGSRRSPPVFADLNRLEC